MRSTAPSLRARNYALRQSHRRWLAARQDDGDDGDVSGADSGDDDDEPPVPARRPAVIGNQVRPSTGLGAIGTGGAGRMVPPASTLGGTGRLNAVPGNAAVPASTLAAGEEEDSLEDDDPLATSQSDGIESGIESASGDELSDDEVAGTPPAVGAPPAAAQPPPAVGAPPVAVQPPPALAAPVGGQPQPPATTRLAPPPPVAAPAQPEAPPAAAPAPITSTTSTSSTSVAAFPVATGTSPTAGSGNGVATQPIPAPAGPETQDLPTQMPTPPVDATVGETPAPTLGLPTPDSTPSGLPTSILPPTSAQEENGQVSNPDNALGAVATEQGEMNPGAAVGIVIGVLALIGVLVAGAFFWRKWRKDNNRGTLPLFFRRTEKDDGNDMAYGGQTMEKDTIPILPPGLTAGKKTNSEMMDQLMQATFKSENGNRQSEVSTEAFGNAREPGFMNETTYTALAGPPTPMGEPHPGERRTSKPVIQWLDGVKTPRQSGAPTIKTSRSSFVPGPVPALPKAPAGWQPQQPDSLPVGRPPQQPQFLPPQPAFQQPPRYTTTTTTSGSDVWYG